MIALDTLAFLQSPTASGVLQELQAQRLQDKDTLALLTRLRKTFSPSDAGALLELARLRQKAIPKFGEQAYQMYFVADALEQASDPLIREYRATQAYGRVLDVCCSIGADSLAFAQHGHAVLGLDIDPLRIALARLNAHVSGLEARFDEHDVMNGIPEGYDTLFFDPARRGDDGKRIFDVERYQPPLSLVKTWTAEKIMVKLSPGVDLAQLADYGGGVEFISVDGDLKEAVLHIGSSQVSRATLFQHGQRYHFDRDGEEPHIELQEPSGWLLEPDPSILRAGLVRDLAFVLGCTWLDETIAFLCCPHAIESVWCRAWQILDWMPFNIKHLRAYLRERNIGQVTVKKRGSPITPEELTAQLKLKGSQTCTVVLTRYLGNPIVIVCADK